MPDSTQYSVFFVCPVAHTSHFLKEACEFMGIILATVMHRTQEILYKSVNCGSGVLELIWLSESFPLAWSGTLKDYVRVTHEQ